MHIKTSRSKRQLLLLVMVVIFLVVIILVVIVVITELVLQVVCLVEKTDFGQLSVVEWCNFSYKWW